MRRIHTGIFQPQKKTIEARLEAIRTAEAVTDDPVIIESYTVKMLALAEQIRLIQKQIKEFRTTMSIT